MQEDVVVDTTDGRTTIAIPAGLRPGANVRKAGEDVAAVSTVLEAGAVLRAQDLAALAALGVAEVDCVARLRVAIVSTGDEVVRPGAVLAEGSLRRQRSNAGIAGHQRGAVPPTSASCLMTCRR
jgi:molybdopterin molybdotransferase